ncbi:helix-turn-helix transcriptional regulator [Hymenobacter busanensis]|uniref:Helix-turn-helix transcriptional regulator n=1 Tax=Hymenobacter busanensis TaxID=2607656 RepID=A0A7L4ZSX2_9BACT|nr:helix-turn-helix transcriptional regulator [Hymenobacter busanensis]QHJ06208.1 helix-turn-helix domain-containing protein [Hymenobacter busanensis]
MVDRIRQLLQARQLSPTQFADTIGVARPIVSHILSGRNKPSLEVVQKIIAAFPDLSMAWLLTGQGQMAVQVLPVDASIDAASPTNPSEVHRPEQALDARNSKVQEGSKPQRRDGAKRATASVPVLTSEQNVQATQASFPPESNQGLETSFTTPPPPAPHAQSSPSVESKAPAVAQVPKRVRRVVIFYSDGTFSDYSPSEEPL